MTKRKTLPQAPAWPTGEHSVGKTLYRKIANLAIQREEHRKAGDNNHLAIAGLDYEIEQVQVHLELIVRTLVLDQLRIDRAAEEGARQKEADSQAKNEKLLPYIEQCMKHLNAKGGTITADAIAGTWSKLGLDAASAEKCPSNRKISELKNLILSRP